MRKNLRLIAAAVAMLCGLCAVAQVRGDVTGEGSVNVSDVNAIVNIILGKASPSAYPGNADCSGDGVVDIEDVNIVVNIILGKDVQPTTITFKRVTGTGQLVAGKRYVIVCEDYDGAMGGMMPNYENYRALVTDGVTLSNGTATIDANSEASIFTLGGTTGAWTLYDGTYYLANTSSSQLNSVTTATATNAKWTIALAGGNATITNKRNTSKTIYYQAGYADFNASSGGTLVQLYVEDDGGTPAVTVSAPTFSPDGGTYASAQTVTIATATSGATIHYTTDGTTPSSQSARYTGPITITSTTTVRAIAILDGVSSEVATATFTIIIADDNANANWHETAYGIPMSGANATTSSATYDMAWRLEYPHIAADAGSTVVVHASSDYGISYSLELAKSQRANRWSCFAMHDGTPNNDVERTTSTFSAETCVESQYQVSTSEYTTGNYTQSSTNLDGNNMITFARGHICASEDRQSSDSQNRATFITSNCHPQYQAHNAGLWQRMEQKVQGWGYSTTFRDTLYVCKGATITDVRLNGSTTSGTIPASEVKSKYGVNITGSLVIPRYWYMAVLCLKDGQYHAMAYWTEQINSACSSTSLESCLITIDELEARTGIDFFCNLPDDIEADVETSIDTSFWR